MLDTNIVSDMIRNPAGRTKEHVGRVGEENIAVSVIVAAELRYGVAKSASARLRAKVEAVLARVPVLPFGAPADSVYADIRDELAKGGKPIGANDLFIAAHALALGAVLVTANLAEFRRVRSLNVENWLA